jgi:tellurite resistance protein TehA-like permease
MPPPRFFHLGEALMLICTKHVACRSRQVVRCRQEACPMMDNMMPGMMWGMGLLWLVVVIVLILAAAALVKYLRSGSKDGPQ